MRRSFRLPTILATVAVLMILALPRSAAAYQHDDDDQRRQASQDDSARQTQQMDRDRSYGAQRNDDQRGNLASDYGYQDGVTQGMHDRQRGRRSRVDDQPNYKQADRGYEGKFGDHDRYRQTYRQAYERGYDRGYNGNGYNQEDRVNDRGRHDQDNRNNDRRKDKDDDRHDNDDHH